MPGLTLLRASRIAPSFIRASSFRDPFPRERFVIVYRIVYPIHGILAHPPHPFETAEDLDAPKASRAWGASLSASKFMNVVSSSSLRIRRFERLMPRFLDWISRWKREKCRRPILPRSWILNPRYKRSRKCTIPGHSGQQHTCVWIVWLISIARDYSSEQISFEIWLISRNLYERFVENCCFSQCRNAQQIFEYFSFEI